MLFRSILFKANQYDKLLADNKRKEEEERLKKEKDKILELEYKSREYDKLMKNQNKMNAINNSVNIKIIDDIKEQRINFLLNHLGVKL